MDVTLEQERAFTILHNKQLSESQDALKKKKTTSNGLSASGNHSLLNGKRKFSEINEIEILRRSMNFSEYDLSTLLEAPKPYKERLFLLLNFISK